MVINMKNKPFIFIGSLAFVFTLNYFGYIIIERNYDIGKNSGLLRIFLGFFFVFGSGFFSASIFIYYISLMSGSDQSKFLTAITSLSSSKRVDKDDAPH